MADCPPGGALALDQTVACQVTYVTTAADVAAGRVANIAELTAITPGEVTEHFASNLHVALPPVPVTG